MKPHTENSLVDWDALSRLRRFRLLPRIPVIGTMSGLHRSPHRGSSVEFAEYRKYVPGDDIRLLDWRVYARTDRFYLREFEADTNMRLHLVVDCSASMAFAGAGEAKSTYAARLAATFATLAVQQGDAAGLFCLGENIRTEIPARRSPSHLRGIYSALEKSEPSGPTRLPELLHELASRLPRRAMVLLFSDCFVDPEALRPALRHLVHRKNDVTLFHLLDPQEINFSFDRPTRFLDMESPSTLLADPSIIRRAYLTGLDAFLSNLRKSCHENGIEYRLAKTDTNPETLIADYLGNRERLA